MPTLRSINVGRPREVQWRNETVTTSIFKTPVTGRVRVNALNLAGDEQADLTVHGGPDKAVYVYPWEHYAYWKSELPGFPLPCGAFGENFTTDGILESSTCIGDRLRIGTAEFMVTQPRMPCSKLGIRFDRADMPKRFLASGRSGFYLRVLQQGGVAAGDEINILARDRNGVSVSDIVTLYSAERPNEQLLRRAMSLTALPQNWRDHFRHRVVSRD